MMRGGGRPQYQNYNGGGGGPYDRRPSPADGYGPGPYARNDPYNNSSAPNLGAGGYDAYSSASSLPRAESPPPLSDMPMPVQQQQQRPVVEMDGTPANTSDGSTQLGTIRDSDTDVAGMVGLQQARSGSRPTDSYMSDSSKYSGEE